MTSGNPVGSIWGSWDLHLHSPDTHLSGEPYGRDWSIFADKLAVCDLAAIGVTNYFTFADDEVEKTRQLLRERNCHTTVFPNLEIRIPHPNREGDYINMHFLFTDCVPVSRINNSLARVPLVNTGSSGETLYCRTEDINRALDFESALIDLNQIIYQLKLDFDYGREVIAGACPRGHGSFRPESGDGRGNALAVEIDKNTHFMFGGADDRNFFLNAERDRFPGALAKPVFSASDAHSIEKIGSRATWIKSEPTFEGLRQTLFEPEDRVHIGSESPGFKDHYKLITSIKVLDSNSWFPVEPIPLNQGLVAIIGGKGSGKTALVDVAAFTCGSWSPSSGSFLFRAASEIAGSKCTVEWMRGPEDTCTIPQKPAERRDGKVKYLSQQFVEDLCSTEIGSERLQQEIENVVFQYIDETNRLGAPDFESLRQKSMSAIDAERSRLQTKLRDLINDIGACKFDIKKQKQRHVDKQTAEKDIQHLAEQMPELDTQTEHDINLELTAKNKRLEEINAELASLSEKMNMADEEAERVQAFSDQMREFYDVSSVALSRIDVPDTERANFRPVFTGDTDGPIRRAKKAIEEKRRLLVGGDADGADAETKTGVQVAIKNLKTRSQLSSDKRTQIEQLNKQIGQLRIRVNNLSEEIARVDAETERLKGMEQERRNLFKQIVDTFRKEQRVLERLYAPVRESLTSEADDAGGLEFYIDWSFDLKSWADQGERLIDRRSKGPYRGENDLYEAVRGAVEDAWTGGDVDRVLDGIDGILAAMSSQQERWTFDEQLANGVSAIDFEAWLYGLSHIKLSYGIKYEGTELSHLSPGTKGIVLMILYLEVDREDTRPLIVDQPEENLDNESIFDVLVSYFRVAKRRRQILLITHNPNLVVNTDADQVIIARFDRQQASGHSRLMYECGALENSKNSYPASESGIRERVCEILEGGEDAFHMRERKYSFSREIHGV